MLLPRTTLEGRSVTLEPLSEDLREAVEAAFATDEEAWSVMVYNGGPTGFARWWSRTMRAMRRRESIVFAVRRHSDTSIVGATGYFGISAEHKRVEIGSTFYQPDARAGPINPDCKLLLMDTAFDAGAVRVEFVTDAGNTRSRCALRKLGATEEGILRRHKITWTGRVRDTVIFSITDLEWASVRTGLEVRLGQWAARA
ncbi:MAG: GNAT family N-acetyltransferase [Acidobacteria bacterium]|nr:GNAT family N-acetyltransferase [Acidobacteriota bacterium]